MSAMIPGRYHHSNIEEWAQFTDESGKDAIATALERVPDDVDEITVTVTKRAGYYDTALKYVK